MSLFMERDEGMRVHEWRTCGQVLLRKYFIEKGR
jgi:hypothetical protein